MIDDGVTPISGPRETGVALSLEVLPREALRAIISKLNERSQQATISSKNRRFVNLDQIQQLLTKTVQEFEGSRIISNNVSVRLILANKRRYDFTTWAELEGFDRSINDRTRSLSVEAVFDIFRGESTVPERYAISVSVQNAQNDIPFSVTVGPDGYPEFDALGGGGTLVASVRYQSYILGKNILSTVQSWIDSLEEQQEPKWLSPRHSGSIATGVSALSVVAGLLACFAIPTFMPPTSSQTVDMFYWLIIACFTVLLFAAVGSWASKKNGAKH